MSLLASVVCVLQSFTEFNTNSQLGQLPQNIALRLKTGGVNVLGTDPEQIDNAEDRHKFSSILDSIGVDQPDWVEATSLAGAKEFAQRVGYDNPYFLISDVY